MERRKDGVVLGVIEEEEEEGGGSNSGLRIKLKGLRAKD